MKKLAVIFALMTPAFGVQAQPRPYTPALSCGEIQEIIYTRGAAVLSTGTHTYDRYVRDRSFCLLGETIEAAWVPARDVLQCPAGYRCRSDSLEFFDD